MTKMNGYNELELGTQDSYKYERPVVSKTMSIFKKCN